MNRLWVLLITVFTSLSPIDSLASKVSESCSVLIAKPRSANSEISTRELIQDFVNKNRDRFDPGKDCEVRYSLLSSRVYQIFQIWNTVLAWKKNDNVLILLKSNTQTDAVKEVRNIISQSK